MADKQYKVNLLFSSDTTLAQQNIQQLGTLLRSIGNTKIGLDSGPIQQAAKDAQQLQIHLQNALNVNTGKLDLSKLNTSLKTSKTSLTQLTSSLNACGPAGQQAFAKIAMAISQAEAPMFRIGVKTKALFQTFANTAKWQLASTAIHGIASACSEGIGYIEDFNKALTDIRIVSDLNDKALANYAKNAQKLAKELNSTGLDIMKGSTIYFQQGLNEQEVAKRVEITTKMANVTGETAEDVSSSLTAIWNNFDDGTKSLESYADVLTYLGAQTAADTEQISTAMEKFAASAKVVGLSYEYAASAVAEVIDRTQMAPEEVGTAFKTILSRLQGLQFGETLEDGVNLNQYAKALDKVGVAVLDQNGKLRQADLILEDLGERWTTLDAAQKKALATTVAGMRQQTQFMALMEEWGDIEDTANNLGDSMNYLNKQNDKYKDSIAGVKKQFEQVKQELFTKIFDEDLIAGFFKAMTTMVGVVNKIVDSFGGFGPMLLTIIGLFSKSLFPIALNGIRNLTANIMQLFGFTNNQIKRLQSEFNKEIQLKINSGEIDETMRKQLELSQSLSEMKQRLTEATKNMGQAEKEIVQNQIKLYEYSTQNLQSELDKQHALEQQLKLKKEIALSEQGVKKSLGKEAAIDKFNKSNTDMSDAEKAEIIDMTTTAKQGELTRSLQSSQSTYTGNIESISSNEARIQQLMSQRTELNKGIDVYETQLGLAYEGSDAERKAAHELLKENKTKIKIGDSQLETEISGAFGVAKGGEAEAEQQAKLNALRQKDAEILAEISRLQEENANKEKENEGLDDRIKKLTKARDLQRDIGTETRGFNEKTVIGTSTTTYDSDDSDARSIGNKIINNNFQTENEAGEKSGVYVNTEAPTTPDGVGTDTLVVENSIENVEKLSKKYGELSSASSKMKLANKELTSEIMKLSAAEEGEISLTEKAKKGDKQAQAEMQKTAKKAKEYANSVKEIAMQLLNVGKDSDELKELNTAMEMLDDGDPEKVAQGLNKIKAELEKLEGGAKDSQGTISMALDQMISDFVEAGMSDEKLEGLINAMKELGFTSEETRQRIEAIKNGMNGANPPTATFGQKMVNITSGLASFASSASMAVSGVQMLMSAFDENNTPMETAMGILSGLSMLLPVVSTLTQALTKTKLLEAAASKLASIFGITLAGSKTTETGAVIANTAAWYANPVMWIALVIIGVVAAIVGLIAIFISLNNTMSENEKALANATASAEALANAYEEAKTAAEELSNAFDSYDNAKKALDECTVGTVAWRNALQDVNDEVLSLLKEYPELATMVNENGEAAIIQDETTGQMIVQDWAKEKMLSDANDKVLNAQAASVGANQKVREAQIEVDRDNYANDLATGQYGTAGVYSDYDGSYYDYSATIANRIADNAENITKMTKEEQASWLQEQANSLGLTDFDVDSWVDAIDDNNETLTNLIASVDENTMATKAENQALATSLLSENEQVANSEYADEINIRAGETYENYQKEAYDKYLADAKKRGWFNTATDESKKAMEDYAKQTGIDKLKGYKVTNHKGDGSIEYEFKNAEGKTEKKTVTAEEIAAQLAATEAAEKLGKSAENLVKRFNELEASGKAYDKALKDFLSTGNFEKATKKESMDLYAEVSKADGTAGDLTETDVVKYLDERFGDKAGDGISDDTAKLYGYETAEEMEKAYLQELQAIKKAWDSLEFDDSAVGKKLGKSLSLTAAQNFENSIKTMNLGAKGAKAGEEFSNGLWNMVSTLSEDQQSIALDKLSEIDWSQWDAMDQAAAIMDEFGVTLNVSSDEWLRFAENMRKANGAIPDFTSLRDTLIEISSVLKEIKFGDIISNEDYSKLIAYKSQWADFFIMQSDGTRKFIGNQKDFSKALQDNISSQSSSLTKTAELIENITEAEGEDWAAITDRKADLHAGGDGKDGKVNSNTVKKFNEKNGTNFSTSEEVIAYQKTLDAESLFNNKDIQTLLSDYGGYTSEDLKDIIVEARNGNTDRMEAVLKLLGDLKSQDYDLLKTEMDEMQASTASSSAELDLFKTKGIITETESYSKALVGLASQYESCTDEVENYNEAVKRYGKDSTQAKDAQDKLNKALRSAEWDKLGKNIKTALKDLKDLKNTEEIIAKYTEIANSINEIFGSDISSTFVSNNLELIKKWANATGKKAQELALQIQTLALASSMNIEEIFNKETKIKVDIDGDGIIDETNSIYDKFDILKTLIEQNPITVNAEGKADLSSLIQSLITAGFTGQEVANILASIGQTEIEMSGYGTALGVELFGQGFDLATEEGQQAFADYLSSISNWEGGISVGGSVPSEGEADMTDIDIGDSGSKPSKVKKTHKSGMIESYKEQNDQLDNLSEAYEKASEAADRLYGANKLKAMREANKILKDELKVLKDKRTLMASKKDEYQTEFTNKVTELGLNVNFNIDKKTGDITNYTAEMEKLYAEYERIYKENTDANGNALSDESAEKIQEYQDKISEMEEYKDRYESTKEELEDMDKEIQDKIYEIEDQNLAEIELELELKIKVNDTELAKLDYYLGKYSSDFYKMSESAEKTYEKQDVYFANIKAQEEYMEDLKTRFNNKEISEDAYKTGIEEATQAIYDNLTSIQELDNEMMSFYENTLAAAQEKIGEFTENMEHLTSVFDHYLSLMDLLGRSKDYDAMDNFLQGKADTIADRLAVAQSDYESLLDEQKEAEEALAKAKLKKNNEKEIELLEKELEDATDAVNAAQEEVLSLTEEWVSAMKEVIENSLAKSADALEKSLSGIGFESLMDEYDKLNTRQEEFLTKTNQIYETNKLMRTANAAADKTENSVAKQKLKNFVEETKNLQNTTKLSKYELELQQAKYDLLVAELALEEAQNAKSTVRLTRDSEGNFGYVYTADSDKIADAQQKYEDAENALYNKSLEGQQTYTEKYLQATQSMYEELTELSTKYVNGEIESEEEYNRQKEVILEHYLGEGGVLETYSSLYNIAVQADADATAENWQSNYSAMTENTEDWKVDVNKYLDEVKIQFGLWETVAKTANTNVGNALDESAKKTRELVTASGELRDYLVDTLIPKLGEEYDAVNKVTSEYAAQRDEIYKLIEAKEKLADSKGEEIQEANTTTTDPKPSETTTPETTTPEPTTPEIGIGTEVTVKDTATTFSRDGGNGTKMQSIVPGNKFYVVDFDDDEVRLEDPHGPNYTASGITGWVYKKDLVGFASGGYTGDWGPEGKLAMLHQKELILNAEDTENILQTVSFVRDLINSIDSSAAMSSLRDLFAYTTTNNLGSNIEQDIKIYAEFPSATNHSEIEEAFNNLLNTASQYANRKN